MAQPTLTEVQNGNNNHLYFELDGLLVACLGWPVIMPMLMLTTITTRRRRRLELGLRLRLRLRLRLTFTMEAIAAIARKAGTRKAAQCVCAMGKHIAWPLLALVLIYTQKRKESKAKWLTNLLLCKTISKDRAEHWQSQVPSTKSKFKAHLP